MYRGGKTFFTILIPTAITFEGIGQKWNDSAQIEAYNSRSMILV